MGNYAQEASKHERRARAKEARAYKERTKRWKMANNGASFTPLRHDLAQSTEFRGLSGSAVKIYCYFLGQFNRYNNGELTAPISQALELMGVSKPTAIKGLNELIQKEFLEITEFSTKHSPTYYGLTCFPLYDDEKPSDVWKKSKE